jgi:hypothetical protein
MKSADWALAAATLFVPATFGVSHLFCAFKMRAGSRAAWIIATSLVSVQTSAMFIFACFYFLNGRSDDLLIAVVVVFSVAIGVYALVLLLRVRPLG